MKKNHLRRRAGQCFRGTLWRCEGRRHHPPPSEGATQLSAPLRLAVRFALRWRCKAPPTLRRRHRRHIQATSVRRGGRILLTLPSTTSFSARSVAAVAASTRLTCRALFLLSFLSSFSFSAPLPFLIQPSSVCCSVGFQFFFFGFDFGLIPFHNSVWFFGFGVVYFVAKTSLEIIQVRFFLNPSDSFNLIGFKSWIECWTVAGSFVSN